MPLALLVLGHILPAQVQPQAWETCSLAEGKGDDCHAGDQPRPFEAFLTPGPWAETPSDQFSGEFQWNIKQAERKSLNVTWREVGTLRSHRIRSVQYTGGGSSFADLLLAEDSRGLFAPLMKWSGRMPEAAIYDERGTGVLVIDKDFGGNIPMVTTWAWVWATSGPVRLDVPAAIEKGIEKVAPGYSAYETGLDWRELHCQTWVWKGDWPGKVGVDSTVEVWFDLGSDGLIVKRAEFREGFGASPRAVRWPEEHPASPSGNESAAPRSRPAGTQLVLLVEDIHGQPVSGVDVKAAGSSVNGRTDAHGTATVSLPPADTEVGWVQLQLMSPPTPLLIVAPCGGVVQVTQISPSVVLARRGDPDLLASPRVLGLLTDCILRAAPPQEKYPPADYARRWRHAIASVAGTIGAEPRDLDNAIRNWSRQTTDPYWQALAALYAQRPVDATALLRETLRTLQSQTAGSDQGAVSTTRMQIAETAYYLGRALYAQRKFAESAALYRQAAAIRSDDSVLLNSLGLSLEALWDYTGAEEQFRRACQVSEAVFGADSEALVPLLENLAALLYVQPDYARIEVLYRRALDIVAATTGSDSAEYAKALHNLAGLLDARHDLSGAEERYRRALAIRRRLLGAKHLETAETMAALGGVEYAQGKCTVALPSLREALAIRESAWGASHPEIADSLNTIGLCAEAMNNLEEAESVHRRALSMREALLGDDATSTAASLHNLASVMAARGKPNQAEPLYLLALSTYEKILGPLHPNQLTTLKGLASLWEEGGQRSRALPLLQRALAIQEKTMGPAHPDTQALRARLAELQKKLAK